MARRPKLAALEPGSWHRRGFRMPEAPASFTMVEKNHYDRHAKHYMEICDKLSRRAKDKYFTVLWQYFGDTRAHVKRRTMAAHGVYIRLRRGKGDEGHIEFLMEEFGDEFRGSDVYQRVLRGELPGLHRRRESNAQAEEAAAAATIVVAPPSAIDQPSGLRDESRGGEKEDVRDGRGENADSDHQGFARRGRLTTLQPRLLSAHVRHCPLSLHTNSPLGLAPATEAGTPHAYRYPRSAHVNCRVFNFADDSPPASSDELVPPEPQPVRQGLHSTTGNAPVANRNGLRALPVLNSPRMIVQPDRPVYSTAMLAPFSTPAAARGTTPPSPLFSPLTLPLTPPGNVVQGTFEADGVTPPGRPSSSLFLHSTPTAGRNFPRRWSATPIVTPGPGRPTRPSISSPLADRLPQRAATVEPEAGAGAVAQNDATMQGRMDTKSRVVSPDAAALISAPSHASVAEYSHPAHFLEAHLGQPVGTEDLSAAENAARRPSVATRPSPFPTLSRRPAKSSGSALRHHQQPARGGVESQGSHVSPSCVGHGSNRGHQARRDDRVDLNRINSQALRNAGRNLARHFHEVGRGLEIFIDAIDDANNASPSPELPEHRGQAEEL